jgi:integrase
VVPKLDESNVRKGKFTNDEAEIIFAGLPLYMASVARFAYETRARAGEILKLKWSYLGSGAISVPAPDTKNRQPRSIALTPQLEEVIDLSRAARVAGCELIFHHDGLAIRNYRKCWQTVCVMNGFGRFCCRNCRDQNPRMHLCARRQEDMPRCGTKWEPPKYIGKLFHDFRRTAAHEMWKAGNTVETNCDCTAVQRPSKPERSDGESVTT